MTELTRNRIYKKLRKKKKGQYLLLGFCAFLSVLLLTSFALMYFGPTVQDFLPEGGDTRKMAMFLFGVTAVGCFIFTIYASKLFFRYKAGEYGIFIVLGMERTSLLGLFVKELQMIVAVSSGLGLLCAVPVSYLIWKMFEWFLISKSNQQMRYRFGMTGFVPGIVFSMGLVWMLRIAARRFVNHLNIMEILHIRQKSEMVKEVKGWTFPVGLLLSVTGMFLGIGLPRVMAEAFLIRLPPAFQLVYLLVLAGVYLMLLSAVAQNRLKKNKKKYYRNLISISCMRFTAKTAIQNMCAIVLLLFVCCFAFFYGIQYTIQSNLLDAKNSRAFSIHFPLHENPICRQDILDTASHYSIEIEDFSENDAANLVISYRTRDFNEAGTGYLDFYREKERTGLFLSEEDFQTLTGRTISVKPGTYQTVTTADYSGFFDFPDGLWEVMNPDTKQCYSLVFDGQMVYDVLAQMGQPFVYVLNDADYREMTKGLEDSYREHMIFFNVSDLENSYEFASDLFRQYVEHSSERLNHFYLWDIWEQKRAEEAGESYPYNSSIDILMENDSLIHEWKYAPWFSILIAQDRMQLIGLYVMLCLYIFIISLAAISVMTYVRSISVAVENRDLFESLTKLGANQRYQRNVLKKQLAKIVQYPGMIGCGVGLLFAFLVDVFNDGTIVKTEGMALVGLVGVVVCILGILFLVYRYALVRAEEIVGIRIYEKVS